LHKKAQNYCLFAHSHFEDLKEKQAKKKIESKMAPKMLSSKRRNSMAQNLRNYMAKQEQTRLQIENQLIDDITTLQLERLTGYFVYSFLIFSVYIWLYSFYKMYKIYERDSRFSFGITFVLILDYNIYIYMLKELNFTVKKRYYVYIVLVLMFFSPLTVFKYYIS